MSDWLLAVLIGIALGLVIGVKLARDSKKKQGLRGGAASEALHYLACAGIASVLPFVLAGIVLGLPFLTLLVTGAGFLAIVALALLIFAALEQTSPPLPERPIELTD